MEYSVIIPAAGQGKRMGARKNKLLLELQKEPIIVHTLRAFDRDPWCRSITLVVNKDELVDLEELVKRKQLSKVKNMVSGGKERQDSVKKGLDALEDGGIVLIHDGARPFIQVEALHELVLTAAENGAAIVAVPVKDTIKRVIKGQVTQTMDRDELWAVQTPQAFRIDLIKHAHEQAAQEQLVGTDDASLVEWLGHAVTIVKGDYFNIKLTTPEDLILAEAIINRGSGQS